MTFKYEVAGQSGRDTRRAAVSWLSAAWGIQTLIVAALWLSDNPQWVWYSVIRDDAGTRALAALLVFGTPALALFGLWTVRRERPLIWPAFTLPATALVAGLLAAFLAHERLIAASDVSVVRDSGILVRAAAVAEQQRVLAVTFFVTAFLLQFIAPIFVALATYRTTRNSIDTSAGPRQTASARAVAVMTSVGALVGGFALGWSPQLIIITSSIVSTSVVVSTLVATGAASRCPLIAFAGTSLAVGQACFVWSFLSWSRTTLFRFFDDPDFSKAAVASFTQNLERAQSTTHLLPWLLLLPLGVVLTGLFISGGRAAGRWVPLPAVAFALGVGSLLTQEPISEANVQQLTLASKPQLFATVKLPEALIGAPELWAAKRNVVVVNREEVTVLDGQETYAALQAENLLHAPDCRTRLARVKSKPGTLVVADATLATREFDCLLVGLLSLQTSNAESDGATGVAPALAAKLGFLLAAHVPAELERYAEALMRYVTVELSAAAQQGSAHLHVTKSAWELVRAGGRERLDGDFFERSTKLRAALGGEASVTIDADPTLPISELLNAALSATAALGKPSVYKWIAGVSGAAPDLNLAPPPDANGATPIATASAQDADARKNKYDGLVQLTTLPFENGGLSHAVVDQVTRSRLWELGSCYNRLRTKSKLSGTVELRIRIARNGLVDEMPPLDRTPKPAGGLLNCARQALMSLRYPEAIKGTPEVRLRIEFGG